MTPRSLQLPLVLVVALFASTAVAQDDPKASSGIGTGISRIAEDTYFETEIGFELEHGEWELAVAIPLRFRIKDLAPPDTGIIRSFDYDEPGDYLGWIRYVEYGRTRFWGLPALPYYGRLGELSRVHMGHGSIVGGYDNIVGFNHKQWGVHLRTNQDLVTADVLLDDIIDPGVIGARVSIRPGSLFEALTRPPPLPDGVLPADGDSGRPTADPTRAPSPVSAPTGAPPDGAQWQEISPGAPAPGSAPATAGQQAADPGTSARERGTTPRRTGPRARGEDDATTDGSVYVGDPEQVESSNDIQDDDAMGVADADMDPFDYPYPWRALEFGVTVVGDRNAPYTLAGFPTATEYETDRRRNIVVDNELPTGFIGFDAQVDAFRNANIALIPYTDVNTHLSHGRGVHFGTFFNVRTENTIRFNSRLEMRAASRNYEPVYFDTSYEAQRTVYQPLVPGGRAEPKLRVIDEAGPPSRLGWYGDGSIAIRKRVRLSLGLGDYQGPHNSLFFFSLRLSDLGPFHFRIGMANRDFNGAPDLFNPANLQLRTTVQVDFLRYFFARAMFRREYDADSRGRYRPDNNWGFGGGVDIPFGEGRRRR